MAEPLTADQLTEKVRRAAGAQMEMRWAIMDRREAFAAAIASGATYRELAQATDLSVATVHAVVNGKPHG